MALQVFIFCHTCLFDTQSTEKGNLPEQKEWIMHTKFWEKKKSLNEKHLRQKRQKDVKPSDQLCHLGKRDREIKEEIFNSLLRLP